MGVDTGGAGDQGLMFGYACRETAELMPLPIMLAHGSCAGSPSAGAQGILDFLRPDGKSQVTVEYDDGEPRARRGDRALDAARAGRRRTTQIEEARARDGDPTPVVPAGAARRADQDLREPDRASSSSAGRRATAG